MKIKNKIEKPFGPAGSWTGIFMFIAGIVALTYSPVGFVLAIPGAFIGFTYESTLIDIDKRRVKNVNYLFGFIPTGKWLDIIPGMKLGLKRVHRGYSTITRGNVLEVHIVDVRILLFSTNNKQILHIKKFNSVEEAKKGIEKLSNQLKLSIVDFESNGI